MRIANGSEPLGELLRQAEYKALWNSKHFVQVD